MITYKTKTVKQKVQESITCDVCKKTYNSEDQNSWMEIQEFHHIRFRGGFDSIFGDDVSFKSDICQHCLKKLLGEYITIDEPIDEQNAEVE